MSHVLTLVAPPGRLSAEAIAPVRTTLHALGADLGALDWLSEGEAADLPFTLLNPDQATAAARTALGEAPVDAIAQPAEGRRKRLLIADMDSTIVTSETLDELAAYAGLKDRVAEITRRSMNGELDFAAALRERVAMLKGLPLGALEETWKQTHLMPGAKALVQTMSANGAHCALASGGFTYFTGRVMALCGFQSHHSNVLVDNGKVLAGRVEEPIFDREAKLATLTRLAAEKGLPMAATMAVGDGANDLAMIGAAGLGIAYHAKPIVAAAARARVDHNDLRALLFVQGYRAAEIVED
ncbi:phosphoserine phosphatase SerB [Roseomonas populi]|uniref:Phosphoserine phosphatase n=1 Tax=Roseomonas populi TaxID=3121582 RepID=A0ABT1X2J1_9PROT|nr:phosphoserine phosphatase SerB [Roseomonas pecuniae]MCR0982302.1 phosphoserine phosphatase SerB [Roseomonas pecuniae]